MYSYKKNYILLSVFVSIFLSSSSLYAQNTLRTGSWWGSLKLNDSTALPFTFEIKNDNGKPSMLIINQEERINITELAFKKDSVFIKLPIFNTEFRLKSTPTSLVGSWINRSRKDPVSIPFIAYYSEQERFPSYVRTPLVYPDSLIKQRWKVTFEPGTKDEYFSVGLFQLYNYKLSGTFTTETGDYRYLEGSNGPSNYSLSSFDGAHAYLFYAIRKNDSLVQGRFYSGKTGYENWVAVLDNKFELRDPYALTYLKPGYSKIDFSFKNLDGKIVSLSDEKFKNKVIIVQLMGSWCPNCMDETKFLSSFYDTYKNKGVEVIGLAFERATDRDKAIRNVTRLKTRFNAQYEFLITEKTGKDQASAALPMLNAIMAFPTTIYIDKRGTVRKIYTGFNGPATGEKYITYVQETTAFIEQLLNE